MSDNGAHSYTEGMEVCNGQWKNDCPYPECACAQKVLEEKQHSNVTNTEQPHLAFLTERGYIAKGKRYFSKGGVFISFNHKFDKCLILRVHPLRPDTFERKSQFNVVYRGSNPWKEMAFAESLWRHLGLHIDFRKHKYDHVNNEEIMEDMETLLKF